MNICTILRHIHFEISKQYIYREKNLNQKERKKHKVIENQNGVGLVNYNFGSREATGKCIHHSEPKSFPIY